MNTSLIRSRLIMPANNKKFIEKAPFRNADALVLDLEDSVPDNEKKETRKKLQDYIKYLNKSASKIYVRVNNKKDFLEEDIKAAVCEGLFGIYLPDVQSAEDVIEVEKIIEDLEMKNGLQENYLKISILIESANGYIEMDKILESSNRIDTVTIGLEDFSKDTGIEITPLTHSSIISIFTNIVIYARKHNIIPMGLIGSISNFNDLENMKEIIQISKLHGLQGASCVHPKVVDFLNKGFSPSYEKVEEAKELIEVFESALNKGTAAITFRNRMVDIPHYEEAKSLINKYHEILKFEKFKEEKIIQLRGDYND
jgi:citrate lyase subunit beta/citryl-CoA lyase